MKQRIGDFVLRSGMGPAPYYTYIPLPLPPVPPIMIEPLYPLLDKANIALGGLSGFDTLLPDPGQFIYMYVRREAVLSSQIEGTQSSLSDLLSHEHIKNVPVDDVAEVSHYVAAVQHGVKELATLPLSLRLICSTHKVLMAHAPKANPGVFRTSQNWIGGRSPNTARFVPPPPEKLMECLDSLEKFIHDDNTNLPILIKVALVHHQFETIHPFLDGNGRLGRLLIPLILLEAKVLNAPILYLSLYFKTHRDEYYHRLQQVRDTGDWEGWLKFFLEGVIETANDAITTAKTIVTLFDTHRAMLEQAQHGRTVLQIYRLMQKRPITSTAMLMKRCQKSLPTVMRAVGVLEAMGIITETTGGYRNKVFVYKDYLGLLNEGTEPLPR